MQSNINPANGGLTVTARYTEERIKRCSRIGVQQGFAQARPAHRAAKDGFFLVPGITKTQFPVPTVEIMPKFAHLTAKPDVEQIGRASCRERVEVSVVADL